MFFVGLYVHPVFLHTDLHYSGAIDLQWCAIVWNPRIPHTFTHRFPFRGMVHAHLRRDDGIHAHP